MSATLDPITSTSSAVNARTVADLLHDLGDIPADRVRLYPPLKTVTFEQFESLRETLSPPCEWVDNTLVEKHVGFYESTLAMWIGGEIVIYLKQNAIGTLSGEGGVMRILPDIGRAPDVGVILWTRFPGGKPPTRSDKVPAVVPDLAIEVLSESNTPQEMARKRGEYFRAGVTLVWEIEPLTKTATVYAADDKGTPVPADGTLLGEPVLPDFRLSLKNLFDRVARTP